MVSHADFFLGWGAGRKEDFLFPTSNKKNVLEGAERSLLLEKERRGVNVLACECEFVCFFSFACINVVGLLYHS